MGIGSSWEWSLGYQLCYEIINCGAGERGLGQGPQGVALVPLL